MRPIAGLRERVVGWLVHRRLTWHLAIVAVLLCLPALGGGWQVDDNFHRYVLRGMGDDEVSSLELFSVMRGGPQVTREYVELGVFPWWTADNFRLAFLRYVSAFTAWLDYALWPDSAVLQHAHSLLWLGAVVFAVTLLYRRIHGVTWVAGLAALLFAIDDAHGTGAGWLANRNALIATLFAVLCLTAHDGWRRDRKSGAAMLAAVLFAMALASGELATGIVGFLLSYALFIDPGSVRQRAASLLPYGVLLAAYALIYRALNFGAAGSGSYVDPVAQPLEFGRQVAVRAPLFLAGQLSPLAADLGNLVPAEHAAGIWWSAVAIVLVCVAALAHVVRRERRARFWALGGSLAVIPLCATFPSNRVLFLVGLGAMPLFALWLEGARRTARGWVKRGAVWAFTGFVVFTHLVLAPLLLPLSAQAMKTFGSPIERTILSLPSSATLAEQDLVVLSAPDYLTYISQAPGVLALAGRPVPRRIYGLAIGPSALEARRIDSRTLDVAMERGFFAGPLGELFRSQRQPLRVGDAVRVPGLTATVRAARPTGEPTAVRFRFEVDLESSALHWVRYESERFLPFDPPTVGESKSFGAALGPFDLLRGNP